MSEKLLFKRVLRIFKCKRVLDFCCNFTILFLIIRMYVQHSIYDFYDFMLSHSISFVFIQRPERNVDPTDAALPEVDSIAEELLYEPLNHTVAMMDFCFQAPSIPVDIYI